MGEVDPFDLSGEDLGLWLLLLPGTCCPTFRDLRKSSSWSITPLDTSRTTLLLSEGGDLKTVRRFLKV